MGTDKFGGVAVEDDGRDQFGGIAVAEQPQKPAGQGGTAANYLRGASNALGEWVFGAQGAAGTVLQAPVSAVKSGVYGAQAAMDRGVSWLIGKAGGDDTPDPTIQRRAQDASAEAAAQRTGNVAADGGSWLNPRTAIARAGLALETDARQRAAMIQADNAANNPELVRQQQATQAADGFVDTALAMKDNPLATSYTLIRSLPDMLMGLGMARGAAAGVLRTAEVSAEAAAKRVALAGGDVAAQSNAAQAAVKAIQDEAVARASTAGVAAEAGSSAYNAREGTYNQVAAMPFEKLADSPRFRELAAQLGDPMKAREALANELADQTPMLSAAATASGSLLTNKLFGGDATAKSVAGSVGGMERMSARELGKRMAQDTVEEGLQGLPEDATQHGAVVQADPSNKLDVGGSLAQNMVAGAAMGGGGHGFAFAKERAGAYAQHKYGEIKGEPATPPADAADAFGGIPVDSMPPVAAPVPTAAETALRTPSSLTALDRVNEIDAALSKPDEGQASRAAEIDAEAQRLDARLAELNRPDAGYGPMFDQERLDGAAQRAALEQERAGLATPQQVALEAERAALTKDWPKSVPGQTTSFSTEAGARIDAQYALMDVGDLVTSHDENLRQNPAYPQELQPRERDRAASEMQVSGIVQKIDPARLGLSADAATGSPIVGADGLVESGNARTIALKRVYQADGQKAADYRQYLRDNAAQFGLTPEAIDAMPKPVLVRVRTTPVNRAEFARQANASTVAQMSPSEQARSDAQRIDSMDDLAPDDNGDFSGPASRTFVSRFMARLPVTEQAGMIDATGRLSTAGYARVRNAVLARAYGDSPVLQRMTESMDDNLRNVSKALLQVAPKVAQMREAMAQGNRHAADITPDLLAAVEELSSVKDGGGSVSDALAQTELLGDKHSPEARALLTFLADNIRRPRRMADFVLAYMEALDAAGDPRQGSMFDGPAVPSKTDLMGAAQRSVDGNQAFGNAGEDAQRRDSGENPPAGDATTGQRDDAPSSGRSDQGDGPARPGDAQAPAAKVADGSAQPAWLNFPPESGTLGIPRADMPQLKNDLRGALTQFLKARGIEHETLDMPASELKPTQAEYSPKKVAGWAKVKEGIDRSVLAASDDHILDGHHQWVAALEAGEPIKVIRFNALIHELIDAVREFPSVQKADGATPASSEDIGAKLQNRIDRDYAGAVAEYSKLPGTDGGRVLDTDIARELSPDYRADRSRAQEVHAVASAFVQRMFVDRLATAKPGDRVVFMAGGGGAGKSSAQSSLGPLIDKAHIVYDGTLSGYEKARSNIDLALKADQKVTIPYVYRDPIEATVNGVLPRAMKLGRAVPLDAIVVGHSGSSEVVRKLAKDFEGSKHVRIIAIDNSHGAEQHEIVPLSGIPEVRIEGLKERIKNAVEREHEAGRISDAIARATLEVRQGGEQGSGSAGGSGTLGRGTRSDAGANEGSHAQDQLGQPRHAVGDENEAGRISDAIYRATIGTDDNAGNDQAAAGRGQSGLEGPGQGRGSGRPEDSQVGRPRHTVTDPARDAANDAAIARVETLADAVAATWANGPQIVVIHDMQDPKVPPDVRAADAQQKSQGASGEPAGFFHNGKAYLVASELESDSHTLTVLMHEALGHYGLRGVFGNKLDGILNQLAGTRGDLMKPKAAEYGLDLTDKTQRLQVAEEVLAELAQTMPTLGYVKRSVAAIRGWARANVPGFAKMKLTDDEIIARFILPARGFVERGRAGDKAGGGVAFLRAFHGTPYRGIDKFSTDAIGTGEGAQAYGWGLYFATKKAIADHYRKTLTGGDLMAPYTKGDKTIEGSAELAQEYYKPGRIVRGYGGADKVLRFERTPGEGWAVQVVGVKANGDELMGQRPRWHSTFPDAANLKSVLEGDGWEKKQAGQLYEVELPEDSQMLDWDKPLSQQPEAVRKALDPLLSEKLDSDGKSLMQKYNQDPKGSKLYGLLATSDNVGGERAASQALLSAGVKGIKYLDGTSRNAGEGSHNYVIFSGDDVDIKATHFSRGVAPGKTAAERAEDIIQTKAARAAPVDVAFKFATNNIAHLPQAIELSIKGASLALDKGLALLPQTVQDIIKAGGEKARAGLVADYGVPEAVIDQRALLQGRQRVQLRQAGHLIEKLATLTRAESRVAYEWMNEQGETARAAELMAKLPPDSVAVLKDVQAMIDRLSQNAVALGQLPADVYEKHKFAYLRRSYAKHVLELDDKGAPSKGRSKAISVLGDQYKGRGIEESASMKQIQNGTPDWWKRKLEAGKTVDGKADSSLIGEKFVRFEKHATTGEGTAPLDGIGDRSRGKLMEVQYHPVGEPLPAKYADWTQNGTFEVRNASGDKLTMWRDFTKAERETMGEVDESRFAIAKTLHGMIHDVEVGRYLEWMSQKWSVKNPQAVPGKLVEASESYAAAFAPGTWVKVPDTKIAGTQVAKYGKLAGTYLPGPIWNDVRQTAGAQFKPLGETYAKLLSAWKTAKTALSPAVHMNNVASNLVMADWHDIGVAHQAKALRLLLAAHNLQGEGALGSLGNKVASAGGIADREAARALLDRYTDSGGDIGGWATNEIAKGQVEPLLAAMEAELRAAGGQETVAAKVSMASAMQLAMEGQKLVAMTTAAKAAGKAVLTEGKTVIELYQNEDEVFRLAAWLKAKEDGATDMAAGKLARKSFMDYAINAPWIQAMRASGLPFIAYTYRAAPMLAEIARTKPHKLLKLMTLAAALNALGVAIAGGGDDKERKLLPEEKAGGVWGLVPKLVRMPWNDKNGSPVYLDIRRFIPVGDVVDLGQGHSAIPLPPALQPGGPLALLGEIVFNSSGFTGKSITLGTDTAAEKAAKLLDHVYKFATPNVLGLPGSYATTGVMDAAKGKTDSFGREQSVAQAVGSAFGVKLGSYPADVLRRNLQKKAQSEMMEVDLVIAGLRRQRHNNTLTAEEFDTKTAYQRDKKRDIQRDLQKKLN